jgi:hypothetical protein
MFASLGSCPPAAFRFGKGRRCIFKGAMPSAALGVSRAMNAIAFLTASALATVNDGLVANPIFVNPELLRHLAPPPASKMDQIVGLCRPSHALDR